MFFFPPAQRESNIGLTFKSVLSEAKDWRAFCIVVHAKCVTTGFIRLKHVLGQKF